MIRNIFTVGGWTLVSRVTGFVRDVVMAAILGAGPVADAFLVAFRLPNHFRAIFAEGAFASAFVPAYARRLEQDGSDQAREFANEIGTGLLLIQVALLALAWVFTPEMVKLLAPGLSEDPARFGLAVSFTRITFPYLALTAMLAMISGTLNANHRFASAAAAPVFLNISMVTALLATPFFPTAGHAAAWGVLIAGFLEVLIVAVDAEKHGFGFRFRMPKLDEPTKRFLKALGPAIVGAGGVQLALFADTIIATFLPAGALSALYYADRINQLPIGVAGIAIGIVLLPEMSRRLAANDEPGAAASQGRAIELSLLIAIPFAAGAIAIPDLVMRALFMRGAFSAADAHAAAMTLAAYATGLIPFMLMRSFTAPFLARGDTATPVKAALTAVAVNILLKIVLTGPLSQVGLALATAAGAWLNLLLLIWAAHRRGFEQPAVTLNRVLILAAIGLVLGLVFYAGQRFASPYFTGLSRFGEEILLLVLLIFGTILYATLILMLLGKNWMRNLLRPGNPTAQAQISPNQRL
ncbi:MAG TPA: murein biosynthesis integral membrane protein MurJ [Xanthobacteraceae bacterium]|jgi:putative peptidoglycan lipid II flippase|nr:murein biosynthesis integral membrane protein MurJ [Xanthobacteraceae bacterium]